MILAAGMTPLVDRFTAEEAVERWRWRPPRALVVLVFYLVLIALIVLVGLLVFPPVVLELEDLAARLPEYLASSQVWFQGLSARYPLIPRDLDRSLSQQLEAATTQFVGLLGQALVVVRLAIGFLSGALNGVFVLILALYITADSYVCRLRTKTKGLGW